MKFGNIKMKPDKSKEFIIQKKIAGIKKSIIMKMMYCFINSELYRNHDKIKLQFFSGLFKELSE